ncbi:MAG TPA: prepilin-type N-terminal cleavage/methylation domain-containing protein [Longimicrobium sp.]|nr:prepilin-type N-terminal cleavage/methylation domain-containing protein [Longimicrobium sp.]
MPCARPRNLPSAPGGRLRSADPAAAPERVNSPQQPRKAPQTARGFNGETAPSRPPFSPSPHAVCAGRGPGGGAHGTHGFTLVEVMVALLVTGLVLGAAYAILGAVGDARIRTSAARSEALPGPAARAALDGWLRSAAVLEGAGPFVGLDRGEPLPQDALSFAVEDGGALHPGPRRIRVWVQPGAGLLAEVTPLRPLEADPADTLLLAPAAAGLQARYRTRSKDELVWLDAWRSDEALPEAVELAVLPAPEAAARADAGGLPRVLRIPLLVPLRWNPDASDPTIGGT